MKRYVIRGLVVVDNRTKDVVVSEIYYSRSTANRAIYNNKIKFLKDVTGCGNAYVIELK